MIVELMNDGTHEMRLVYEVGNIAQFQAKDDNDGFPDEVFFNVSRNEAIQIIKGLQNYVDGK